MSVSIVYQNVRGLRTKLNDFNSCLLNCDADIVCITETWLNQNILNAELSSGDYEIIRRDRNYARSNTTVGGSCLIACRNGLSVERIPEFETILDVVEDLWIKVKLTDSFLYVCVTYIRPNAPLVQYTEHLDKIKDCILSLDTSSKFLILGDYNMPHISWNLSTPTTLLINSAHSEELLNTIEFCNFNQFNNVTNINGKILDLVLSNLPLESVKLRRLQYFKQPEDNYHPALQIDLNLDIQYVIERRIRKYNFRKDEIDWNVLNALDPK